MTPGEALQKFIQKNLNPTTGSIPTVSTHTLTGIPEPPSSEINLLCFLKAFAFQILQIRIIPSNIWKEISTYHPLSTEDELFLRALEPVKTALKDSGLAKSEINTVILAGWMTWKIWRESPGPIVWRPESSWTPQTFRKKYNVKKRFGVTD